MRERVRRVDPAVVVVTMLVVLAGCNGLVPGESEQTPVETVTPVPIEAETATPTATPRPTTFDWFVSDGEIDVDALYEEHTASLSNASFTLVWRRQAVGGSGPTAASYDRRIAVVNDTTYSRRDTGTFVDGTIRTFNDPSGLYRSVEAENGSTRNLTSENVDRNVSRRFALLGGSMVDLMVVPDEARVRYAERGGTLYAQILSSTPPEYLQSIYADYNVENFSVTVWVHPDRYVQTIYYEFSLVTDDERIDVGERYTYTAVGETTLDQPEWVVALDANGTATPTPDGNGTSGNATVTPGGNITSTPGDERTETATAD